MQRFSEMNHAIFHRGLESDGYFMDEHIQLRFRRLSIIDLEAGHQPISYENERYIIVFNGEIYNYVESKGYTFRTQSDTEVILALYADKKRNAKQLYRCLPLRYKCKSIFGGLETLSGFYN